MIDVYLFQIFSRFGKIKVEMSYQRQKPITTIKDGKGRKVYQARFYFHNEYPGEKYPIRKRLISEEDLEFKKTVKGPKQRTETEKTNLLEQLYQECEREVLSDLAAKEEKKNSAPCMRVWFHRSCTRNVSSFLLTGETPFVTHNFPSSICFYQDQTPHLAR